MIHPNLNNIPVPLLRHSSMEPPLELCGSSAQISSVHVFKKSVATDNLLFRHSSFWISNHIIIYQSSSPHLPWTINGDLVGLASNLSPVRKRQTALPLCPRDHPCSL